MQIKWKQVLDSVFEDLIRQIDVGNIKPGTKEERLFLRVQAIAACKRFAWSHLLDVPCQIEVNWSMWVPDELQVVLDKITTEKFKQRGLYE